MLKHVFPSSCLSVRVMVSLGLVTCMWFTKAAATVVKLSSASACAAGVLGGDGSRPPLATSRAASSPQAPFFDCWSCGRMCDPLAGAWVVQPLLSCCRDSKTHLSRAHICDPAAMDRAFRATKSCVRRMHRD